MQRNRRRGLLYLVIGIGLGMVILSPHSYGYNALVPHMIANLNRLHNIVVGIAMTDFERVAEEAGGLVTNGKVIRGLVGIVVTDSDAQKSAAFQTLAHELEEHAEKLQAAANQRDEKEVRHELSEVLEYCIKCHQQFRDEAR
jgi:cytochrome c556